MWTPSWRTELSRLISPLAGEEVRALDALIQQLERVAPVTVPAAQLQLRQDLIDIVAFARGLGGDALPPEPTRGQTRRALQNYLGELRSVAARIGANPRTALPVEAQVFITQHGGGGAFKDAVAAEIGAVERALSSGSIERCGFVGRGQKGDAVAHEVASRLAAAFALHVGPPGVSWSHPKESNVGPFLDWATLILDHAGLEVGESMLRDAAREHRAAP